MIRSYGGDVSEANVHTPRTVDELRAVLARARAAGSRVTFRGGGCAFDTQSLNTDVVVAMTEMRSIAVDPVAATVTAEAGATWGEIARAAGAHGLVPHSLVTTRSATIAGTTAADCLSRFSPTLGKEGEHVVSFDLLTGELLHCSREAHRDVFYGAVGGLGYLGAITRVTVRLLALGRVPRVETVVTPLRSVRDSLLALVPRGAEPEGIYCAFDGERAIHFRSRYVDPRQRRRPLWLLHQPRSPLRALFDLVVRTQPLTRLGSWLTFHLVAGRPRTHVDDFEDYAFFMDGNALAKSVGHALGAPMRTLQQTFVLPASFRGPMTDGHAQRALAESVDRVVDFVAALTTDLSAAWVHPTMLDCLFLPQDEPFLLSSSADFPGFALSVAFDTSNEDVLRKARRVLVAASARCREMGGRVHLIKNVCADPADLSAMYGEGVKRFFALKRRLDPSGVLRNDFLARVFPAEVAALARADEPAPGPTGCDTADAAQ